LLLLNLLLLRLKYYIGYKNHYAKYLPRLEVRTEGIDVEEDPSVLVVRSITL